MPRAAGALAVRGDVLAPPRGCRAPRGRARRCRGTSPAGCASSCSGSGSRRADGRASTAPSRAPRGCAARSGGRSGCRAGSRRARSPSRRRAGCAPGSHSIRRSISGIGSVSEAWYCFDPATDLALEVVARLAVVGEPDRRRSRRCAAPRSRGSSRRRWRRARAASSPGSDWLPEHAALDELHDVERACRSPPRPRTGSTCAAPGTSVRPSAVITRYSRSTACAEGSSFAAGAGFVRIT